MAGHTLRLRHSDVLRALETIDLLEVVGWELGRRLTGAPERSWTSRFIPDHVEANAQELTGIRDVETGQVCLIPTPSLQMIASAGFVALAVRELMPPGVVTAAVYGSGATAQLYLGVIAGYVPDVSHAVVVQPAGADPGPPIDQGLLARLDRAEIALSVVTDSRAAAVSSNLLIIADLGRERLNIGRLPVSGLTVNATRRDLPDEMLAQADRVYVDDLGLLEHNQHRKFVRSHLAGATTRTGQVPQPQNGWHRRPARWRREQCVETDLGHVLTGEHERVNADDVLLVELLGGALLDVTLGRHIHRAALHLGLGLPGNDGEGD